MLWSNISFVITNTINPKITRLHGILLKHYKKKSECWFSNAQFIQAKFPMFSPKFFRNRVKACCKQVPAFLWFHADGHLAPVMGNSCGLFILKPVVIMSDVLVGPRNVVNSLCKVVQRAEMSYATKEMSQTGQMNYREVPTMSCTVMESQKHWIEKKTLTKNQLWTRHSQDVCKC